MLVLVLVQTASSTSTADAEYEYEYEKNHKNMSLDSETLEKRDFIISGCSGTGSDTIGAEGTRSPKRMDHASYRIYFYSYSCSVKRYSYSMAFRNAAMLIVERSDRGSPLADRDAREILKGCTRGCVVTPDAAIVATRRDALAVRCE